MRSLAFIANLGLLGLVGYMTINFGLPSQNEVLMMGTMIAAPILSLVALWRSASHVGKQEESTFQLARKAIRAKLREAAG